MAKFILEGSDLETEKEEFLRYLDSQVGNKVVTPLGETTVLSKENLDELADTVSSKAQRILKGIEECIENTVPISEEFVASCTPKQREIMGEIGLLHKRMESFQGNQNEAVLLAAEMRDKLSEAIDSGLGNVDLIVRKALVYGLADRIPEIDTTGTVFVGTIEKIKPAP